MRFLSEAVGAAHRHGSTVASRSRQTTYGPNSPNRAAFVEYGDHPEEVRDMSGAPATVYATLVAPDADPAVFRIEDDPPPCA
jgi:hypothetical protein